MNLRLLCIVALAIIFSGCAMTQKATPVNHLQIKVAQLERRLEDREEEMSELKYAVERLSNQMNEQASQVSPSIQENESEESSASSSSVESSDIIRVSASAQDVQRALKRAGYYTGPIDGKIGSGSKKAIVEFQQDHQLKADGIIGKKTWEELSNYLE